MPTLESTATPRTTPLGLPLLIGLVAALALVVRPPETALRPRLTRAQTRIGFLAYFATLSAYFTAGWWVLTLLPLGF